MPKNESTPNPQALKNTLNRALIFSQLGSLDAITKCLDRHGWAIVRKEEAAAAKKGFKNIPQETLVQVRQECYGLTEEEAEEFREELKKRDQPDVA